MTRANASDRCEIDNNEWTLWDGFQTLPSLWKPLQDKAYSVRGDVRRSARYARERLQPPLRRPLRRLRDGFQTLNRGRFSDD